MDSGRTSTAFKASQASLVQQYDAYETLPGAHVKGELTLGENIGDLAGLTRRPMMPTSASLGGKDAPVIDGIDRRPALLPRLGAGLAAQLSRGEPSCSAC